MKGPGRSLLHSKLYKKDAEKDAQKDREKDIVNGPYMYLTISFLNTKLTI